MMLTSALTLLAAASSALAATQHTVIVGQNKTLTYTPNTVAAAVGDVILFQFQAGNHTVTESSFADPCHSNGGFKSGFQPVSDKPINLAVQVNTDKPIWIYCGQPGHCQNGMVFAVNAPTEGNTFQAFVQNAQSGASAAPSGSATSASAGASYISTWTAQTTLQAGMTSSVSAAPTPASQSSSSTSSAAPAQTSGGTTGFIKPSVAGLFLSFVISAFM